MKSEGEKRIRQGGRKIKKADRKNYINKLKKRIGKYYGEKRTEKLPKSHKNNMGKKEFKKDKKMNRTKEKCQKGKKQKYHYILAKEKN